MGRRLSFYRMLGVVLLSFIGLVPIAAAVAAMEYDGPEAYEAGVEEAPVRLTVQEAVERALVEDRALQLARLTLDNAKMTYDRAIAGLSPGASAHEKRTIEIDWLKAQETYRNQVADAVMDIVEDIIELRRSDLAIAVDEKRLESSRTALVRAEQKREALIASSRDVVEAELSLKEASLAYEATTFAAEQKRAELAMRLGLDAVVIDDDLVYAPFDLGPASDVIAQLEENDVDLLDLAHRKAGAELEVRRLQLEQAPLLDVTMAENTAIQAAHRLEVGQLQLRDTVENAVRAVQTADVDYDLAVRRYEIERERFDNTLLQAEAGFITDDDLLSAEVSLLQRESSVLGALKDYWTAVLSYHKLLGDDVAAHIVTRGGP